MTSSLPMFVGTGPVVVDLFIMCDELPDEDENHPAPGCTIPARDEDHFNFLRKKWVEPWTPHQQVGGAVTVALRQARNLGARVRIVGSVGDDELGTKTIVPGLESQGFDTSDLVVQEGRRSGSAIIWVDRNGDHSSVYDSGDLDRLGPEHVEALIDSQLPDVGLIDGREPAAARALAAVLHERDKAVHYDIDQWEPWTQELIELSSVVQIPYREALAHSPYAGTPAEVAQSMHDECRAKTVIVTDGERGLCAYDEDGKLYDIAALPVETTDSLGAGDVFAGAFEMSRLRGSDIGDALGFASSIGALHSTTLNNQILPTQASLDDFFAARARHVQRRSL